ncbi:MAG: trehalose 6-phosphate synthase [Chloroflexota bacterium]|nr:trehalose 6-phosphate synthase [Chloroflexota bacterium]
MLEEYARHLLEGWHPVIAANRAPVEVQKKGSRFIASRGAGGLVSALSTLASSTDAVWVGCARTDADREVAARHPRSSVRITGDDGRAYSIGFVTPDEEAYDMYYNQISNPLLWFIQHYLWNLSHNPVIDEATDRAWTQGYVHVNRLFAEKIVQSARRRGAKTSRRDRPLILIQDYQLYLVAKMVRERMPEATLQQFIHIPWPTPQYWKVLPDKMRDPIVEGLLGNDIVAFQTPRDCRNFLLTCEENLHLPVDYREQTVFVSGRTVWVRAYPVSIDVDQFTELAGSREVLQEQRNIRRWRPERLIIRVDRSDPSKNLLRGFAAYDRLLQQHPELAGTVQFWAYLQPSRQDIPIYRKYLEEVQFVTRELNQRYGREGWRPVRLELRENLNRAVAAYKEFDVLLVNSIYDGMNLVAKEGMMVNERDGVLILSENTGSYGELGQWAFTINPFDVDATAEALYQALVMDEKQRRARLNHIRASVRQNDIARWISAQLQDIRDLTRAGRSRRRRVARTVNRIVRAG